MKVKALFNFTIKKINLNKMRDDIFDISKGWAEKLIKRGFVEQIKDNKSLKVVGRKYLNHIKRKYPLLINEIENAVVKELDHEYLIELKRLPYELKEII